MVNVLSLGFLLYAVFHFPAAFTLPLGNNDGRTGDLTGAMVYLMKYGYLDTGKASDPAKSAPLISSDGLKSYIEEFQAFANLSVTGKLDQETLEMMGRPRCGVKDIVGHGAKREKRYALQGSRWKVKDLTYRVSKYPVGGLTTEEVDKTIAEALKLWSDITELTFTRKETGQVHIDISFARYNHGDGDPFDGRGGTLAHAYFPIFGGNVHFDDSELWTINSYRGTNLLQTAAHEFGHSLGLSHSDQFSALMAPFYRGYESNLALDKDDVRAIQALYGKKTEKKATSSTASPDVRVRIDTTVEELCQNSTIDSILTISTGSTYTFKGDQYWKLTDESIAPGYPRSIEKYWGGLPANIDASFTWTNGKSYFFKGDKYWRFSASTMKMDPDYPKLIREGFEGIPDDLDAAFVWSGNGKIYFFKGSKYWKFDPEKRPPVSGAYPRPISNWEGIPDNIDDAIQYTNGYTYFFKKGLYYRFDDRSFQVDSRASPSFPRPAGYWWFGCTTQPREGSPEELLQADQPRADVMPRGALDENLDVSDEVLDSEGASRVKTKSLATVLDPSSIIPLLMLMLVF